MCGDNNINILYKELYLPALRYIRFIAQVEPHKNGKNIDKLFPAELFPGRFIYANVPSNCRLGEAQKYFIYVYASTSTMITPNILSYETKRGAVIFFRDIKKYIFRYDNIIHRFCLHI